MLDPQKLQDDAAHVVIHAWISLYLAGHAGGAQVDLSALSSRLNNHAQKLQESAGQLASALEKMRMANAKLALRMAEHKAFFAKYQPPQ
jgi:hypothetical protein